MRRAAPWRGGADEPLWAAVALAPLIPASWLYGGLAAAHRSVFERGGCARRRLAQPVLSVGNLGVGGAGKTPFAAWLALRMRARGWSPALASRGYRRRGRDLVVVSDGRRVLSGVDRSGDEPLVLAAAAPGVPVVVARDRGEAGLCAVGTLGADLLVLDDGFQHHRLARDLDLVLVDGGAGFGNRRVLPRGPLREPGRALARADALGVVDGPLSPDDERFVASRAPGLRRFRARRVLRGLRPLAGWLPGPGRPRALEPARALAGEAVGILAGLANPASLERSLEDLGARVVARRLFPDHHRFRARDLRGLAREAPRWITTEKDAFKLRPDWCGHARVEVVDLTVRVEEEEALLGWVDERLAAGGYRPRPAAPASSRAAG